MQKLSFLYLVLCSLFDTNNRKFIEMSKNYKVSVAVKTCFQLPYWHDIIFGNFFLLQSIKVSIFYGLGRLELISKVSFRVRTRFRHVPRRARAITRLSTMNASWLIWQSLAPYAWLMKCMVVKLCAPYTVKRGHWDFRYCGVFVRYFGNFAAAVRYFVLSIQSVSVFIEFLTRYCGISRFCSRYCGSE